jgi:hypothetical protein
VARLLDDAWGRPETASNGALVRTVQAVVVDELLDLAADEGASVEARAAAEWGLARSRSRAVTGLAQAPGDGLASATRQAHAGRVLATIDRFLERNWTADERSQAARGPGWSRVGEGDLRSVERKGGPRGPPFLSTSTRR